jgi:hypothetical protein
LAGDLFKQGPMDNLKPLEEALPTIEKENEDSEKPCENKPTCEERRKMMRDEAVKIFNEKFLTPQERQQIEASYKAGIPEGHSFYFPDFVPDDKIDLIPKLLAELGQAQKIDNSLKQKYFPKLTANISKDEVITLKASDLKAFMDETLCERKRAEEYLTAARGDLQKAYRLFIENVESGDEQDLELSLVEEFNRDERGIPI